ncbi:hypothetical protein YC2023_110898 [Brassica napus]
MTMATSVDSLREKLKQEELYLSTNCKVGENEEANNKSCYTLVNQVFAIAVRKVLQGYISGIDTLCASAELRRSSNIVVFFMNILLLNVKIYKIL